MNPIVHGEIGWLCGHRLKKKRDRFLVALSGIFPDIDGLGILISDELYELWHHRLTHGLAGGIFVLVATTHISRNKTVGLLSLAAYHLHLLCDLVGSGPGWPMWYFWPFSDVEWMWSWQWDLASWQNSLIGLFMTLACLGCARRWGRTPVELFSQKADTKVVQAIQNRFGVLPPRTKPESDDHS
jgi:inner membrane protein